MLGIRDRKTLIFVSIMFVLLLTKPIYISHCTYKLEMIVYHAGTWDSKTLIFVQHHGSKIMRFVSFNIILSCKCGTILDRSTSLRSVPAWMRFLIGTSIVSLTVMMKKQSCTINSPAGCASGVIPGLYALELPA